MKGKNWNPQDLDLSFILGGFPSLLDNHSLQYINFYFQKIALKKILALDLFCVNNTKKNIFWSS